MMKRTRSSRGTHKNASTKRTLPAGLQTGRFLRDSQRNGNKSICEGNLDSEGNFSNAILTQKSLFSKPKRSPLGCLFMLAVCHAITLS